MRPAKSVVAGVVGVAVGLVAGVLVGGRYSLTPRSWRTSEERGHRQAVSATPGMAGPHGAAALPETTFAFTLADAQRQFDSALEAPGPLHRRELLDELCARINAKLAQPALAWAEHLPAGNLRASYISALLLRWAELDPVSAIAYAQTQVGRPAALAILQQWVATAPEAATSWALAQPPASGLRVAALHAIAVAIAAHDPERALVLAREIDAGKAREVTSAAFTQLAEDDPASAAARFADLSELDKRDVAPLIARSWAQHDSRAALAWVQHLGHGVAAQGAMSALISSLAETDPHAAADLAREVVVPNPEAMSSVVGRWAADDPDSALAWVEKLPKGKRRDEAMASIVSQLAPGEPERALHLAETLPRGQARENALSEAVVALAEVDVRQAAALAMRLGDDAGRGAGLSAVAGKWAEHDPHAAWAWARSLPAGRAAEDVMGTIIQSLAAVDPRAAVEAARDVDTPDFNMLGVAMGQWVDDDPAAALAWVHAQPQGRQQRAALATVATQLAVVDPKRGAAVVQSIPEGETRDSALRQVASYWGNADIDQALVWAKAMPEGPDRQAALATLADSWATADPQAAALAVGSLSTGEAATQLMLSVAARWGERDPQAALGWAEKISADGSRVETMAQICGIWATNDPRQAAQYVEAMGEGEGKRNAVDQVAVRWATYEPAAAAQWISERLGEENQAAAVDGVITQWARQDMQAAGAWVDSLPDGAVRDQGLTALAGTMNSTDPHLALQWSVRIGEPLARQTAMINAFTRWHSFNAPAANDWLARAPLSSEDKTAFVAAASAQAHP